jgi:hypothetical protein
MSIDWLATFHFCKSDRWIEAYSLSRTTVPKTPVTLAFLRRKQSG